MATSKVYYTVDSPIEPIGVMNSITGVSTTWPYLVLCDNPYLDLSVNNGDTLEYHYDLHAYVGIAEEGGAYFVANYFDTPLSTTGNISVTWYNYKCQRQLFVQDYYFNYNDIVQGSIVTPNVGDMIIADNSSPSSPTGFAYPSSRTYWTIFGFSSDYNKIFVQRINGSEGLIGPQGPQGNTGPTGATGPAGTANQYSYNDTLNILKQ